MKATIKGVEYEGTVEELAALTAMVRSTGKPARETNETRWLDLPVSTRASMYRELIEYKRNAGTLTQYDLIVLNRLKPRNGVTKLAYWTRDALATVSDNDIVSALDYGISARGFGGSTADKVYREYKKCFGTFQRDMQSPLIARSSELIIKA